MTTPRTSDRTTDPRSLPRQLPTWTGSLAALRTELGPGARQALGRWWAVQLATGLLVAARQVGASPSWDGGLEVRIAASLPTASGRLPLARRAAWEAERALLEQQLGLQGWPVTSEAERRVEGNRLIIAYVYREFAAPRPLAARSTSDRRTA